MKEIGVGELVRKGDERRCEKANWGMSFFSSIRARFYIISKVFQSAVSVNEQPEPNPRVTAMSEVTLPLRSKNAIEPGPTFVTPIGFDKTLADQSDRRRDHHSPPTACYGHYGRES